MRIAYILITAGIITGCRQRSCVAEDIHVNLKTIDSFRQASDTTFTKKYRNADFVKASYYLNRKDSTVCQLMFDDAEHIRQVSITRKNIRILFEEYYPSGQLQANLPLDADGRKHGNAVYYFPGGCIKSTGKFHHGFYSGTWKNFDEKGRLQLEDTYDSTGQLINSARL